MKTTQDIWDEIYDLWYGSRRCDSTRNSYAATMQMLVNHCDKNVWDVVHTDVISWLEDMRSHGLAETTVQNRLCAISSFYKFAVEECDVAWVGKIPGSGKSLRRTIEPYGKATWLSADEVKSLLSVIDRTTFIGLRDYALLLGYILTGRRNNEWLRAKVSDFETRGKSIIYRWYGKGKKDQRQILPTPVWDAIKALVKKTHATSYLFTSHRTPSIQLCCREANRILKKYAELAGIDSLKIHVHTLRHTAAMLRKESGSNIEDVMGFLSHSNLSVTQIYLHSLEGKPDTGWIGAGALIGV